MDAETGDGGTAILKACRSCGLLSPAHRTDVSVVIGTARDGEKCPTELNEARQEQTTTVCANDRLDTRVFRCFVSAATAAAECGLSRAASHVTWVKWVWVRSP